MLLTYYEHVAEWKFSDVLTNFLRSYNGDNLVLAYTLSELIHEDNPKDKFNARFHLLQAAVNQGNQIIIHWIEERVRKFILTEVPPTKRLSFIETFNQYVSKVRLLTIQNYSIYPKAEQACQGDIFTSIELVKSLIEKTCTKTGLTVIVNLMDKVYAKVEK